LEDNIKMDLYEIEWEGVDWIYLLQGRISDGLLWMLWQTFMFHKTVDILY
jgi:hypothetical protein